MSHSLGNTERSKRGQNSTETIRKKYRMPLPSGPLALAAPRSHQFRFRLHQLGSGALRLSAAPRSSTRIRLLLLKDSALHPPRGRTTMASADFSTPFTTPPGDASRIVRRKQRPPRVRHGSFLRDPPDLPHRVSAWLLGLPVHRRVTPRARPSIRFLFVESGFRLGLPSDPTSR